MFGVYAVYDCGMGFDEMLMGRFDSEAEAEAFMAQLEAEDLEMYGEPSDSYYVGEVF